VWSDYCGVGLDEAESPANQEMSESILVGSLALALALASFVAATFLAEGSSASPLVAGEDA
jgi:hypothetical protein